MSVYSARALKAWVLLLFLYPIVSCEQQDPVVIGFIGGISGRVADLGVAGRNGFILAIEERNARGGLQGQPVQYLTKDDQQNPAKAREGVKELIDAGVAGIVGPMTSAMAMATVDQVNRAKLVMMGATVTTNALTGIDDYFFRTIAPGSFHAGVTARYLRRQQNISTAKLLIELGNKAYTQDWAAGFTTAFEAEGGEVAATERFTSGNKVNFAGLAERLLADTPQLVVLVMNSVDAALMVKQIRDITPDVVIAASEWAGTERLIELGGILVEGIFVPQYLDRASSDPDYLRFRDAYTRRFGHDPGFPGMISFNATNVMLEALARKAPDQDLKSALLANRQYTGIQNQIILDDYGDASSRSYMTRVIDGKFEAIR